MSHFTVHYLVYVNSTKTQLTPFQGTNIITPYLSSIKTQLHGKTRKRYEHHPSILESESMVYLEYSWACSLVDVKCKRRPHVRSGLSEPGTPCRQQPTIQQ